MYTLDDLKQLKSQWMAENDAFARELAHMCMTVGGRRFIYPREYCILKNGDFTALATMTNIRYAPKIGEFQTLTTLVVYTNDWLNNPLDNSQLWARMNWVNIGEKPENDDDFIVPGDWMDGFQRLINAAHEELKQRHARQLEGERRYLLAQLHLSEHAEVMA